MKNYEIVPNPIYDNVFKYLLEDKKSAIIILSVLSGREIIKLDYDTGDYTEKKTELDKKIKIEDLDKKASKKKQSINKSEWQLIDTELELQKIKINNPHTGTDVVKGHLDFIATVRNSSGIEELIMIELQKENQPDDIYRFKRYIANKFTKKTERIVINSHTKVPETKLISLPILPIFILNFKIENDIKDLVLHTNNITTGLYTNKTLKKPNEFIDNLTYGIIVVQLAHLDFVKKNLSSFVNKIHLIETYKLLSFFDQNLIYNNNPHRLRYDSDDIPKKFKRIVRRLKSAALENPDLEEQMHTEDEYLQTLKNKYRTINSLTEKLDDTTKELDNTAKELDKEKIIRKQVEDEKKQAEEREEQAEMEKKIIKLFYIKQIPIEDIAKKYNLSIDKIKKILEMS